MKKLLISATTEMELQELKHHLSLYFQQIHPTSWLHGEWTLESFVSGPGIPMVLLYLGEKIRAYQPNHLIHVGIAGGDARRIQKGQVAQVISDRYADIGAETAEGSFSDMFSLKLWSDSEAPFQKGWLINPDEWSGGSVPKVRGVTVNTIPGRESSILQLRNQVDFDIETMEGAAVFHLCQYYTLPFLALRGISNDIEPRNRYNWDVEGAIRAYVEATMTYISHLVRNSSTIS